MQYVEGLIMVNGVCFDREELFKILFINGIFSRIYCKWKNNFSLKKSS